MDIDIKNFKHIIWNWNGILLDDTWLCVRALLCLKKPPCRRQGKSLNSEVDLSKSR